MMPDSELEGIIIEVFSKYSHVWRKCARMTYWYTKIKNINPFPLPEKLPDDALELAVLALKRMCLDVQTKISVLSVWMMFLSFFGFISKLNQLYVINCIFYIIKGSSS